MTYHSHDPAKTRGTDQPTDAREAKTGRETGFSLRDEAEVELTETTETKRTFQHRNYRYMYVKLKQLIHVHVDGRSIKVIELIP